MTEKENHGTNAILKIEGVSAGFGKREILSDVSLSVMPARIMAPTPLLPEFGSRMAAAAGRRVVMPSASARLARNKPSSTSQGRVPSAVKKILRTCRMLGRKEPDVKGRVVPGDA